MIAIAFDLVVAEAQKHHPKGVAQAYADKRSTLAMHGLDWVQGSLYVSRTEDLAKLFAAKSPGCPDDIMLYLSASDHVHALRSDPIPRHRDPVA